MRFLVDECTGPGVARWLREQGHDVISVYEESCGISDDEVLSRAYADDRILVTNDKDFGKKIFVEQRPHRGVILLRLEDERATMKIQTLGHLLAEYEGRLHNTFVVVTEERIRLSRSQR